MFNQDITVGEVLAISPDTEGFFTKAGIDFCCGGNRKLVQVLKEKGLNIESSFAALEGLTIKAQDKDDKLDFRSMSPKELCDYIVKNHHNYLREVLPEINQLTATVIRAHGIGHPELFKIGKLYGTLRGEIEQHILHEELTLFPALSGDNPDEAVAKHLTPEIIEEHEQSGEILAGLRSLTNNYTVPSDACPTYKQFYKMLEDLEHDMHWHIHLENNILFVKYDIR